jgi:hypothetical protein
MSAPITEAHCKLRETLEIRWMRATEWEIEQLIADSEAKAVAEIRAEFEKLTITAAQAQDRNVSHRLEWDQLRADWEDETKWAAHYLAESIAANARAERAEAELATEREKVRLLVEMNEFVGAAQLAAEREKVRVLRLACDQICEEWGINHDANPIGAGQRMSTRAGKALEATEDAQ